MHIRNVQSRRTSSGNRRKWLLLFNCQAAGLGHCLALQGAEIDVEFHDHASAARHREQILAALDSYERILVQPTLEQTYALAGRGNVWLVPPVRFHAYHPDMCWLGQDFTRRESWPLDDCHSIIAYTSFTLGLDVEQALILYRDDVYSALGYYTRWEQEADWFYAQYCRYGFDMSGCLTRWNRSGGLMYLPIHPKIDCLNDLARAILRRAGVPITNTTLRPQDNLVGGPAFPVYPEIGMRLGVAGDYLFKLGGRYCLLDLPQFVARSYRYYEQCVDLTPSVGNFSRPLARARTVIAAKMGIALPPEVAQPSATSEMV